MAEIEKEKGRVVGVFYADSYGTPLSAEATDLKMDSMGWEGGFRISDQTRELWNATSLWPGVPGVFVLRTSDMTVVASEAGGGKLDLIQEARNLNE